jgi:PAS domain S-box-containing protein
MKQQQARKSNLTNERAYLKLIEDSPDGFLVLDQRGFGLFANTKTRELLQREEHEIIGKEIGLPILGNERVELELPGKDGSTHIVELQCLETTWNEQMAFLCNLRDITVRKSTEEMLDKHREFLEKTGELAKVGGWEVDLNTRKVYWSKTTRMLHEVADDYIPDLDTALSFFSGENREQLEKAINDAIYNGESYDLVLELITAKGNHRWVHAVGIPEMFRDKCIRLWGVLQDITRQKEVELEQKNQAERFRVALSDSSIIVWQQDKSLKYKWIYNVRNGMSEADVVGKTDRQLLTDPQEIAQLEEIKFRVMQTGQNQTAEVCATLQGQPRYYRLNVEPLRDDKKEIVGITCVSIDITQLKSAYKKLEIAKERAEESDKLKSAFLANLSHEIRTPMNGIMGFANLLKSTNLQDQKRQEFIDIIQQSGKRMLNIIDELVDIAKVEANQAKVVMQEVVVNEILEYQYSFFSQAATEKGLELRLRKALPDNESVIITDPDRLSQILTNLINNAIKFTMQGAITFGYEMRNDSFQFFVSDTGIGIETHLKDKVFERFRQAELHIARKYEGAGLGLSIAKAYIELMGGHIWVDTEKDKGTTFYFALPRKGIEEVKEELDNADGDQKQGIPDNISVLVAEDDEASFMLFKEIVSGEGVALLRAYNGKEALDILEANNQVDIVLMDIKMPVMNGYEATKLIKAKYPGLPVVIQSAFTSERNRQRALEAGCDAYLAKPIKEEKLYGVFAKLLKANKV